MRQKNKRGDSKVESNDSPGIPDREEISDIPGLPSGIVWIETYLNGNEVLFLGISSTLNVRHPVARCTTSINEVA